jgi:chromosome segregation ATPase
MVIEELNANREEYRKSLLIIEAQLKELQKRLSNLYEALETGKLEIDDLAPRIRELRAQIEEMQDRKKELEDKLQGSSVLVFSKAQIKRGVTVEMRKWRSHLRLCYARFLQKATNNLQGGICRCPI